ncbi:MAG: hypothetical protein H7832_09540 [Magnetococcus sp. DMHC-6]
MAIGGGLIEHLLVEEARQVEENLAESRVHAAITGILRYGVNLTQRTEFTSDSDKILAFCNTLVTLNGVSIDGVSVIGVEAPVQINASPLAWRVALTFTYPSSNQGSGVYLFKIYADIIDVATDTIPAGTKSNHREVLLEFTLTTPTLGLEEKLVPVLEKLENHYSGLLFSYNSLVKSKGRIFHATYGP